MLSMFHLTHIPFLVCDEEQKSTSVMLPFGKPGACSKHATVPSKWRAISSSKAFGIARNPVEVKVVDTAVPDCGRLGAC